MSSEAEFERLYQEWVNNGGGAVTFTDINTPVEYYDGVSSSDLTPDQIAELQARQTHYNRTQALQVFSSEISANNFTNPYDARSTSSINSFTNFAINPSVLAIAALSSAFSDAGLSSTETVLLLAGLSTALGFDFSNMLLVTGLAGSAIPMYGSLQNHTNSQITNLPQTLEQASSLADMNQQFGEQTDSCSLFNELMGIMSGAFDGVMDFMDAGLDKLTELLGPIIGVITDITAGIIGAISGGISAIVDAISDMIPQSIKDIFNEIGNIAKSMMNGIAALANQIASEIANLTAMAATISAKLAALALAAATLDPCKLAVLLNTGSPELKSAAQNMTSPVTNVVPTIATELDPRANATDVNAAIQSAKQIASTAAGVPQSPMTASAKLYSPFDAYLHNIEENFASIFGTGEAFGTNPTTSGGKIVAKLPETGSTSNTSDKEIATSNATREFESKAFVTWKSKFLNDLMLTRTKSDKIKNDIKVALNGGAYFPNSALKDEAKSISGDVSETSNKIKSHVTTAQSNLSYTSETGKRDNFEEQEALTKYNNIYSTRTASLVERVIRDTNTAESRWNSIRSQIIYNAPR